MLTKALSKLDTDGRRIHKSRIHEIPNYSSIRMPKSQILNKLQAVDSKCKKQTRYNGKDIELAVTEGKL
jgi:hypothetical protein